VTMRLRPGDSTRKVATETIGLRDRALLLIGFAGALRRSELVGLDVSDLTKTPAGSRLRVGASKTEQEHPSRSTKELR
jgi:site-specific recombinase XerD